MTKWHAAVYDPTSSVPHVACRQLPTCLQVLVVGKVSQAVVLSWAAYRDETTFRDWTGIDNSKLVCDATFDTHVSAVRRWFAQKWGSTSTSRMGGAPSTVSTVRHVCQAMSLSQRFSVGGARLCAVIISCELRSALLGPGLTRCVPEYKLLCLHIATGHQ